MTNKKLAFLWMVVLLGFGAVSHADMTWNTPIGTIGLPVTATEAVLGFDAILKQSVAGVSLPVYIAPNDLVRLQVGAVAAWPNTGATVEPYIALSHNILKEIPTLNQFKSCEVNVFGRYASEQGKAGLGVAFSYAFAGGPVAAQ